MVFMLVIVCVCCFFIVRVFELLGVLLVWFGLGVVGVVEVVFDIWVGVVGGVGVEVGVVWVGVVGMMEEDLVVGVGLGVLGCYFVCG